MKALFRRGVSLKHLKEFSQAADCLKLAIELDPKSKVARTELAATVTARKEARAAEKARFGGMFDGVFEAQYIAQIAVVRADSWTGAHLYTRS